MRRANTSITKATYTKPRHGAARDHAAFAMHRLPDFLRAVHTSIGAPHARNLGAESGIALCARWHTRRVRRARFLLVVQRGIGLQLRADRLDPEGLTMRVNEAHDHGPRRSSSAWAKYADAAAPDPATESARQQQASLGRRLPDVASEWPVAQHDGDGPMTGIEASFQAFQTATSWSIVQDSFLRYA